MLNGFPSKITYWATFKLFTFCFSGFDNAKQQMARTSGGARKCVIIWKSVTLRYTLIDVIFLKFSQLKRLHQIS